MEVTLQTCIDDTDVPREVSRLLTHLSQHGIPADAITVLTGHSVTRSRLPNGETLGSFRLCAKPTRHNDVRLESVHRFKGLESPVIVLCEMSGVRLEARQELWYTALSRAQAALWLISPVDDGTDIDTVVRTALAASTH